MQLILSTLIPREGDSGASRKRGSENVKLARSKKKLLTAASKHNQTLDPELSNYGWTFNAIQFTENCCCPWIMCQATMSSSVQKSTQQKKNCRSQKLHLHPISFTLLRKCEAKFQSQARLWSGSSKTAAYSKTLLTTNIVGGKNK